MYAGVDALCESAVRLTGVDGAAVAVLTPSRRVRDLVYATDHLAQRLDELQYVIGEGPASTPTLTTARNITRSCTT